MHLDVTNPGSGDIKEKRNSHLSLYSLHIYS